MKTVLFLSDYENQIEFDAVFEQLISYDIKGVLAKPRDITIFYDSHKTEVLFLNQPLQPDLVIGYAFEGDLLPAIRLMEIFKSMGVQVINDGITLFNGQHKDVASAWLSSNPDIRHLPYLTLNNAPSEAKLNEIGFPVVVKPTNSSGGKGLMRFDNYQAFNQWYNENSTYAVHYYAQPYIPKLDNKDFRIVVVNYKACYAYQRTGYNDSWITNLCSNGSGVIFEVCDLSINLINMSEAAAKASSAPFCGVDIALDENNNPFIIEINTCPAIKISHYINGASDQVERAFASFINQQLTKVS
ncbi:hypothetical protein KCM76_18215 [Zooshikella marina]|uniref:ATP-grasp domain-containing protein n=1 Tax=Zooshikella ganghwensis TaxID=202772 RepID=UPI001BAE98F9|nr:hypothetical protein [Zooshikella ganghwensis]MBU2707936.1 hypothetical protein [Zooshikella ganghwensis]